MASINFSCPTTAASSSKTFKNFGMFNGLHCMKIFSAHGFISNLSITQLGGGDLCSHPNGTKAAARSTLLGDLPSGIGMQSDTIAFGTLAAETTSSIIDFPIDTDEFYLDLPSKGFSSIPEAIEDIRQGKFGCFFNLLFIKIEAVPLYPSHTHARKFSILILSYNVILQTVVVVDDEDRENEGDLIMAASKVTPEAMAFFVKHGTGIVCVSMEGEDLERLQLPLMVAGKDNEEKLCTAFTVSVDAKHGTTTGVSAHDRATTILALASKDSKPEDFNRPGHIFPLKYRKGGVLKRAGHTEASVDLVVLAGFDPVAVLCEIVDDDGSMARLPKLKQFAVT